MASECANSRGEASDYGPTPESVLREAVKTAGDLRLALLDLDVEPYREAKRIFPAVWCEWASVALAEVLHEKGLGRWDLVTARRADSDSGHAWLESAQGLTGEGFSLDLTLDQFEEFDSPYFGPGRSPAIALFPRLCYVGPWEQWPVVEYDDSFERYASEVVRRFL